MPTELCGEVCESDETEPKFDVVDIPLYWLFGELFIEFLIVHL